MENADQFLTHIIQIVILNITLWFPLKFYLILNLSIHQKEKLFLNVKLKRLVHTHNLSLPKQLLLVFGNVSVSSPAKLGGFIFFIFFAYLSWNNLIIPAKQSAVLFETGEPAGFECKPSIINAFRN